MAYTYQIGANQMDPSNWNPQWAGAGNTSGGKTGGPNTVFEQFEGKSGKVFNHTCAESFAEQTLTDAEYEAVSKLVQSGEVDSVDEAIRKVTGKSAEQIQKDYSANKTREFLTSDWLPDWAKKNIWKEGTGQSLD